MLDERTLADLVSLAYTAASEPAAWTAFLDRFGDSIGGSLTALHGQDVSADRGELGYSVHFDPRFADQYREHYCSVNVFMTGTGKHLIDRPGTVVTGQMLCADTRLLESEYYNDWLRPQDVFHLLGGPILREGSWTYNLSTLRPRRAGPFGDEALALLRALMPHLQRALQIHRRLQGLEAYHDATSSVIDQLPLGVILLDEQGRALLVNRAAQRILDENDGLSLGVDGPRSARPVETAALRRLVHEAGQTGLGHGVSPGGAMSVSRPSLKRPLAILVGPLAARRCPIGPRSATAVLFVSDPERGSETPPELLRRLYGLTPAEARLTAVLLEGKSVTQAAEQLGIRPLTARTQLKTIFRKTRTSRQSDLVRLLMIGPAVIRGSWRRAAKHFDTCP